jgi:hypothetical protein
MRSTNAELIWKDGDLAISSVRGVTAADGQLVMAVGYERTIAVQLAKPIYSDLGSKRWGDDSASMLEASIIRLSPKDGAIVERRNLSAGLGISLQGIEIVGGEPIVYGSLGGVPAMTNNGPRLP